MGKVEKRNRGRPSGSLTTVRVRLKDLLKYLTPNATVVVGKQWLTEIGFNIKTKKVVEIEKVKEMPQNTKIEVKDLV